MSCVESDFCRSCPAVRTIFGRRCPVVRAIFGHRCPVVRAILVVGVLRLPDQHLKHIYSKKINLSIFKHHIQTFNNLEYKISNGHIATKNHDMHIFKRTSWVST